MNRIIAAQDAVNAVHGFSPPMVGDRILSTCDIGGMKTLAERIRWVAEAKGLSMRAWGMACGYSSAYVNMLARGETKEPSGAKLAQLARYAGVNSAWLTSNEGPPEGPARPPGVLPNQELPGWFDAEKVARMAKPGISDVAFLGGRMREATSAVVTPERVAAEALAFLDTATNADLERIETLRLRMQMASEDAERHLPGGGRRSGALATAASSTTVRRTKRGT